MNRNYLINAIKELATAKGYSFHLSESDRIAEQIKGYPLLMLESPKFVEIEGRRHGKVTYAVKLHAMDQAAKLSPDARNVAYTGLEDLLVEIFMQLSKKQKIICVESLQISSGTAQLTPHGEIAVTATAKVITTF